MTLRAAGRLAPSQLHERTEKASSRRTIRRVLRDRIGFLCLHAVGRARRYLHPRPEHRILAQMSSIPAQETDDTLCICTVFRNHEGVADMGIPTLIPTQEGRSPTQGSDDPYRLTNDCLNRMVFGESDFGTNPNSCPPFSLSTNHKAISIPRGRYSKRRLPH